MGKKDNVRLCSGWRRNPSQTACTWRMSATRTWSGSSFRGFLTGVAAFVAFGIGVPGLEWRALSLSCHSGMPCLGGLGDLPAALPAVFATAAVALYFELVCSFFWMKTPSISSCGSRRL